MSDHDSSIAAIDTLEHHNSDVQVRKKPSLTLNALSNWVALGVSVAIGFLLTPAIMSHLGDKRFGMWMLVSSVVGYFGLLRLGVSTGVLRYAPLFRGKGDQHKIDEVVNTAIAFYIVVGFFISLSFLLCAGMIATFFQGGREMAALMRVVALAAGLECLSLVFDAIIKSYEGFTYVNTVAVIAAVLRAGALLGCILMDYGLLSMGWVLVGVSLITLIAKGVVLRNYCMGVKFGLTKISLPVLRMLLMYGLVIMVESAANLLTVQSPKLVIAKTVSLEAVGIFAIAHLLIIYYGRLVEALSRVFMPRFSYLSGQNANMKILQLFCRGTRYIAIVAGAVALLIWTVGTSFLELWTKNDSINQVFPALMIIAVGALVFLSHRLSMDLLYGLGKQKKLATFAMIEGISILGFSLALSFRYGITGVAVGASVPLLLVRGGIQTIYVCRLLKIGFLQYYGNYILKSWIITIVLAVAGCWLGITDVVNNWLSLFLVSVLIMLVYGALTYVIVIEAGERHQIKDRVLAVLKYPGS